MLYRGEVYLEDGLHRALRAALENRNTIHVRILDLDALEPHPQVLTHLPTGSVYH